MPRPRMRRFIRHTAPVRYFKPQGIPLRTLRSIELTAEELEALRLKHMEDLDQQACAEHMGTSQSTLQRILASAHAKVSTALVEGCAIRILSEESECDAE